MTWILSFVAGLFEYSEGFSRLLPTLGMVAAGTAVVGILLLGESAGPLRVASLALIVAGVVGLRLAQRRFQATG